MKNLTVIDDRIRTRKRSLRDAMVEARRERGPMEAWEEEATLRAEQRFTFDPSNVRGRSPEAHRRFVVAAEKRVARRRRTYVAWARFSECVAKAAFRTISRPSLLMQMVKLETVTLKVHGIDPMLFTEIDGDTYMELEADPTGPIRATAGGFDLGMFRKVEP